MLNLQKWIYLTAIIGLVTVMVYILKYLVGLGITQKKLVGKHNSTKTVENKVPSKPQIDEISRKDK